MSEPDVDLWQALGISADAALDGVPDDVWASAVQAAVDPAAPEADASLVPDMDDAEPELPTGAGDLAALLHDDPAGGHHGHGAVDDTDIVLGDDFDDAGAAGHHHHDAGDGIDLDDSGL